jgi:hypothetical protein
MRALCGAIITAGSALGLGLTAVGIGIRYYLVGSRPGADDTRIMHLADMDRPLIFALVFLTIMTLIGLGIAFVGLAYHHHRRHHEHLREQERHAAAQRTTV